MMKFLIRIENEKMVGKNRKSAACPCLKNVIKNLQSKNAPGAGTRPSQYGSETTAGEKAGPHTQAPEMCEDQGQAVERTWRSSELMSCGM